jgi:predicted unusual protein kinase regulating ubiquinone biosynthesis (AarF/ABC1/UbiB family)
MRSGPSLRTLLHRATVLLGLILQAAWVYARLRLASRGWWSEDEARRAERMRRFARRFVDVAMRFRAGLIKLGQVASLRVEVLPEVITDELARLQDRVDPHPFAEISGQIERELGAPPQDLFLEFDARPIAAASLGQVHAATAQDGRRLAVKILYPGIERSVAVDLAMARLALWLFDFFTVGDLAALHRELARSIQGEMDYVREGRAAEEIAANLSRDAALWQHLRVPTIHWDLTTRRILAMEFIDGVKINDFAILDAQGARREDLVLWASRAFLHMMFRDGFFHCDPHPGNLIVDPQGRIGIIDFGMNERVSPELLAAIRDNMVATVTRDADLFASSLHASGAIDASDIDVARQLAELNFDPAYFNLTPQEMANLDLGAYLLRMRGQMKRLRNFRLPTGIAMWWRALSVLYGVVLELAPGLRPLDVIGPYVLEFLQHSKLHAPPVGN